MATGTANSTPPPPVSGQPAAGQELVGGYGESVQRHLRQTERQVKFVDLCTALLVLAAGAVGYLLGVIVIDHWVLGLGFWGRLVALSILLGGAGWYFTRAVLPLLTQRINPLYAARSIEQGTPSLKNSLINFLMIGRNQSAVHRVVYQAMEQKAATDLASVPVDTAVDRSTMIKAGYVLVSILAAGAAYTILSPKDPFQTLARVALPWEAIARPTRVVIEEVQPGTIEGLPGQLIDVTARVRGARAGKDAVSLVYSTTDGQTVERFVTMELDENGLFYHARLPADRAGLQHDVEYRVESGDVVSETFTVTLSPAPSILVDSIEYDYPSYTRRSLETVPRDGNIRALEGTRVTIVASANKPIRSALITFNPFQAPDAEHPPVELSMDFQGKTARQTFTLALAADRQTPIYHAYQLSFVTAQGALSEQPILHQIDVVPDLAPEVEILEPTQNRITIPVSGRRKIEVRAVDPDFGLSRLSLRAVATGSDVLDEVLFEDPEGRPGQTIATYEFVPSQLGLTVNDKVTYWAVAEDNHMSAEGLQAAPNTSRTRNYQIEIVSDPPTRPRPGGEPSAGEQQQPKESGDPSQPKPKPEDPADDKPSDEKQGTEEPSPDDSKSDPGDDPEDGGKEEETESQETEDGASSGAQGGSSDSPDGKPQEGAGGAPQEGQPESGDASSSGGSGGNTPQQGGQPDSASAGQGSNPAPEELHDGEVFEKVLRKIEEEQAQGQGKANQDQANPNGAGNNANNQDPPRGDSGNRPDGAQPSDKPPGQADDQGKPQGDAAGQSQGSDTNSKPFSDDTAPQPDDAASQPGDGAQQPDIKRGAGPQKAGNPGEGGDTNESSGEQQGKPKPDVPGEPDNREKEPGSGDNGESGAGQNSEETEGTGSVEGSQDQAVENRDAPENRNPDSTEPQEKSDPGSTNSEKQSDSDGGESGDQSGGGKKGPGQGANQAGNDSAGQNSSADDGAGAQTEAGDGETSDQAGGKQDAAGKTGTSGNKQGDGSSSRKDPNGNKDTEGATGSAPEAEPGQENRQPKDRQKGGSGGSKSGKSGPSVGGGVPSDSPFEAELDPNLEVGEGDAANLEYSRKATDMVLDHLKDLETRTDSELLKELGWTPEEMKQFVDRWQRLKRGAADDAGRRELDESLKSLGLRSPDNKLRQRRVRDDEQHGLSESGGASEPPAAYRDAFKAFQKGRARVRRD